MKPSISVVIPVYNRFDLLTAVVDSILAQTLPVLEVILVDDGSIDNTPELLPRHVQETPSWRDRVQYIYQENQGQSAALNTGIARARGEWLAISSNDDLWLPQKLERQFQVLEQYDDCGLCFTDAWFMNTPHMKSLTLFEFAGRQFPGESGKVEDAVRLLLHHQPVWCQTTVVKTDIVRSIGGFDRELRFSEDYDFVFRLALQTKFCYVGLPMVLIDRTPSVSRHTGAALDWQKKDFKLRMDERRLVKMLELSQGLAPDIQKGVRENMRAHFSKWANWYLERGESEKALTAITRAKEYDWTPGVAVKWFLTKFSPGLAGRLVARREHGLRTQNAGINC
jgi:glycosyltransferase involved in cell wall biosynthesis